MKTVTIYYDTPCGKPECTTVAVVVFLYRDGTVPSCLDHAKETMDEFIDYMSGIK